MSVTSGCAQHRAANGKSMTTTQSDGSREIMLLAGEEERGQRLDRWLASQLPAQSRSALQRWIEAGQVLVNGKTSKAGYRLETGDHVVVQPLAASPTPTTLQPLDIPLKIVYEDADLLVLDKPAGLVVHPAAGHQSDTLVNALLHYWPELATADFAESATFRPGLVHRLDKETSGLIVIARHDRAQRALQAQFKARTVYKEYLALVDGYLEPADAQIVAAIGRHPHDRQRQAILTPDPRTGEERGRLAITEYHVLGYYSAPARDGSGRAKFSLVRAVIHTGRTHQIRVHFAWRKHPVVGDRLYGYARPRLPIERQFLHAHRLRFVLPSSGELREFVSPLPDDLQQVLDRLEQSS